MSNENKNKLRILYARRCGDEALASQWEDPAIWVLLPHPGGKDPMRVQEVYRSGGAEFRVSGVRGWYCPPLLVEGLSSYQS